MAKKYTSQYYEKRMHLLLDHSILLQHSGVLLVLYLFLDKYIRNGFHLSVGVFGLAGIYVFVVLVRCFIPYFHHSLEYHPLWYGAVVVIMVYLFGLYLKDEAYRMEAIVLLIYLLLGFFWCTYLQEMTLYLQQQRELEEVPRSQMLQLNTKIVLAILTLFFLSFVLVGLIPLDFWWGWIKKYLGGCIAFVLQGIGTLFAWMGKGTRKHVSPEFTVSPDVSRMEQPVQAVLEETNQEVNGYIILAILISMVFFFYLVKRLATAYFEQKDPPWERPYYAGHLQEGDDMEDIATLEKKSFFLFRSNREKIRHRFKQCIKKNMRSSIPQHSTPRELAEAIEIENSMENSMENSTENSMENSTENSMENLTRLYEKARYSDHIITKEDVVAARVAAVQSAPGKNGRKVGRWGV